MQILTKPMALTDNSKPVKMRGQNVLCKISLKRINTNQRIRPKIIVLS